MKALFLMLACMLGWWFYRPASPNDAKIAHISAGAKRAIDSWPENLPAFGRLDEGAFVRKSANANFVSFLDSSTREDVLARAREAFAGEGWRASMVRARDMLIFTRGEAVAAVLAQSHPAGTHVSVIQRHGR